MIQISSIKKRKYCLSKECNNDINISLLTENVSRHANYDNLDSLIRNWRRINVNEEFAFIETMDIFNKSLSSIDNKADIINLTKLITEEVIPSIKNLKNSKNIISKYITEESKKNNKVIDINKELNSIGIKGIDKIDRKDKLEREVKRLYNEDKSSFIRKITKLISIILAIPIMIVGVTFIFTGAIFTIISAMLLFSGTKEENSKSIYKMLIRGRNKIKKKIDNNDRDTDKYKSQLQDIDKAIVVLEKKFPELKKVKITLEETLFKDYIYESILESVDNYIICDRMLNNQDKLNKLNFENILIENNTRGEDNFKFCINELCSKIDSLNIDSKIKYNLALENIIYSLDKNHINYCRKDVLENITNYFLCTEMSIDDIKYILEKTPYYNMEDKSEVNYIIEGKSINKNKVKELINNFKLEKPKTPESIKKLIYKIYTQSPEQIIDEVPNFLTWIRTFLTISTLAVNPILGCIVIFTDQFIAMKLKREQYDKFLAKYKSELTKTEKLINKTKDSKKREKLEAYEKTLKENISKLEDYTDSLYTDREKNKRWGFDDVEESTNILIEAERFMREKPISIEDYYKNYHNKVILQINKAMSVLHDIINSKYKSLVSKNVIQVIDGLELDKFTKCNNIENYLDIQNKICLNIGYFLPLNFIEKDKQIQSTDNDKIIDILCNICDSIQDILDIDYCCSFDGNEDLYYIMLSFNIPIDIRDTLKEQNIHIYQRDKMAMILAIESELKEYEETNVLQETSFINNIRLARERLKSKVLRLSDKEKAISKTLDYNMEKFNDKIQDAMVNKNREAVIKGSILPSASTIIKIAIATPIAWAINPAITIIGILGGIALAKLSTERERQFILDEIEIQLKLVEKKIQLAENNSDMKSLEELLKIEKRLKREKTRIEYHKRDYRPVSSKD